MRPTQIGTSIAAVTVLALGAMTAYKGQTESVATEQQDLQQQIRSKNQVTIAREILANNKRGLEQYPEYPIAPELGEAVPSLQNSRLTSFRSSTTGLYYFIGKLNGVMGVRGIYSVVEIQTSIDLLQQEGKNEVR